MRQIVHFACITFVLAAFSAVAFAADPAPAPAPAAVAPAPKPEPARAAPEKPAVKPPKADDIEEVDDVTDVSKISSWNPDAWRDPAQFPALDRGINLLTTRTVPKWHGSIIVDHRANEAIKEHPFDDFLGLDAGSLKIGLGLRLGLLDNLDVGIYRLNGTTEPFDTYEFDVRWRFLDQEKHWLSAAVRAGGTWFYVPSAADDSGVFGQLILEHLFARRVLWNVSALYHSNSTSDSKTARDPRWSLAIGTLIDVRLAKFMAWELEAIPAVAGFVDTHPYYSTALKFITNRHTFSIIVSTSQLTAADGVVSNTSRNVEKCVLGFKIVRELP